MARALTSLVLIQHGLFPLVVTRDDRTAYLDALEAADDGDLKLLVDLIATLQRVQFRKAVTLAETVLSDKTDVGAMLDGLLKAADKTAVERRQELERVFDIAGAVKERLRERLDEIAPGVRNALLRITTSATARVGIGDGETGHWYRAQIIQNAKHHLGYFVNFGEFRSWVALHMTWERRARLVFAIHGIGHGFTGSLICAPFLEILDEDEDEDGHRRSTLVPVAEEGFIFFYNDTEEAVLKRLQPWLENVLKITLKQLTENL